MSSRIQSAYYKTQNGQRNKIIITYVWHGCCENYNFEVLAEDSKEAQGPWSDVIITIIIVVSILIDLKMNQGLVQIQHQRIDLGDVVGVLGQLLHLVQWRQVRVGYLFSQQSVFLIDFVLFVYFILFFSDFLLLWLLKIVNWLGLLDHCGCRHRRLNEGVVHDLERFLVWHNSQSLLLEVLFLVDLRQGAYRLH